MSTRPLWARCAFMPTALPTSKKKLHALIVSLREELRVRDEQLQCKQHLIDERDAQLREHSALIEKLKFELARLKRWRFGADTEALSAEQLSLWESELDGDIAALQARVDALEAEKKKLGSGQADDRDKRQPKRRPLPESLPRLEVLHDLESKDCPKCGQGLARIGEEVSEQLDIVPAKFFVRRHVRPKYCCRHCETLHTAPMPAQPSRASQPFPHPVCRNAGRRRLLGIQQRAQARERDRGRMYGACTPPLLRNRKGHRLPHRPERVDPDRQALRYRGRAQAPACGTAHHRAPGPRRTDPRRIQALA
ncbi:MAG: hypothetical protein GEV05_09535 [Betaproteobacteria bacterium]|nr:hypothetical protein [Betaproteobacteria bacterium]